MAEARVFKFCIQENYILSLAKWMSTQPQNGYDWAHITHFCICNREFKKFHHAMPKSQVNGAPMMLCTKAQAPSVRFVVHLLYNMSTTNQPSGV